MSARKINPIAKLVIELGPIVAFFVAYGRIKDMHLTLGGTTYDGFIVVTAAFIPLMLLSTGILWWLTGKLSRMQMATVVLVVIFGGLSVWFNDERFFKMKPTIIYLLFAGILGAGLLRGQSYLKLVMEEVMPIREEGWMILTRRITAFFFGLAIANEVIWRSFSTGVWVSFKTFGLTLAVFVFFVFQNRLMTRFAIPEEEQAD